MDRKSIVVLVVCFALIILWQVVLVPKFVPPDSSPPGATNAVAAAQMSATTNATQNTTSTLPATNVTAQTFARPEVPEELLVVTNDNARYTFTSHGGGLQLVELLRYPESVGCHQKPTSSTNQLASLNTLAPVPVLTLLGENALVGDGVFKLTPTATGMRAEKKLPNGLNLVKEFQPGSNYLLTASVRLENQSTQTLALPAQEWVVGTATPMGPLDNGQAVSVMWYNGDKAASVGKTFFNTNTTSFFVFPRIPTTEVTAPATLMWLGWPCRTNSSPWR